MNVYLARQPIFNSNREVVAYELLFRSSERNAFDNSDSTDATLQVVKNSFSLFSLRSLLGDKKAFINFDEKLINSRFIELFSPDYIIIEVLESVKLTPTVLESLKWIKNQGYKLALDDFNNYEKYDEIIDYIDFIKVDFLQTINKDRESVIKDCRNKNIRFIAEKIETLEDMKDAIDYGYSFFQGFYLSKPIIISTKEVFTNKLNYISVIEELNKKPVDIFAVEDSIKRDLALSYKLLRLINSASLGIKQEITSIRQAIVLIGVNNLKRWIYVITLKSLTGDKHQPLITTSLVRARFGELLVEESNNNLNSFDIFLTGMLSLIDRFIDMPIEEILRALPISNNVKASLTGEDNINSRILGFIMEYESGNWRSVDERLALIKLSGEKVYDCYLEALAWVQKIDY